MAQEKRTGRHPYRSTREPYPHDEGKSHAPKRGEATGDEPETREVPRRGEATEAEARAEEEKYEEQHKGR